MGYDRSVGAIGSGAGERCVADAPPHVQGAACPFGIRAWAGGGEVAACRALFACEGATARYGTWRNGRTGLGYLTESLHHGAPACSRHLPLLTHTNQTCGLGKKRPDLDQWTSHADARHDARRRPRRTPHRRLQKIRRKLGSSVRPSPWASSNNQQTCPSLHGEASATIPPCTLASAGVGSASGCVAPCSSATKRTTIGGNFVRCATTSARNCLAPPA